MSDTYIALAHLVCDAVLAVCAVVTVVHLIKKDRRSSEKKRRQK